MTEVKTDVARLPDGREAYVFDSERFEATNQGLIDAHRKDTRALLILLKDSEEEKRWAEKYSGKIPKEWVEPRGGSPWHQITEDIENGKVKLTSDQIRAAAEYHIWHIPYSLGIHRPLNFEQLKLLAEKMGGPPVFDEIIEKQVKFGKVTPEEATKAENIHSIAVRDRLTAERGNLPGITVQDWERRV